MKSHRLLPLLAALACAAVAGAQADTVAISGTVYNIHTRRPEPYSLVLLAQDSIGKAVRVCDSEGFFLIDSLPTGSYTIRVGVGTATLYQDSIDIYEPSHLTIYMDTIQLINLRTVTISDKRLPAPSIPPNKLEYIGQLITSADDPRLWDMSGRMNYSGPACADLSRGETPAADYRAKEAKKKMENHLWYNKPTRAKHRRRASAKEADSTATR